MFITLPLNPALRKQRSHLNLRIAYVYSRFCENLKSEIFNLLKIIYPLWILILLQILKTKF